MKLCFIVIGFVRRRRTRIFFTISLMAELSTSCAGLPKTTRKTVVEPNYPDHELEYLVGLGTEVRIRVGLELFSLMGDSEAIRELCDKAATILRPAIKD